MHLNISDSQTSVFSPGNNAESQTHINKWQLDRQTSEATCPPPTKPLISPSIPAFPLEIPFPCEFSLTSESPKSPGAHGTLCPMLSHVNPPQS